MFLILNKRFYQQGGAFSIISQGPGGNDHAFIL